jgi:hypothetical protein
LDGQNKNRKRSTGYEKHDRLEPTAVICTTILVHQTTGGTTAPAHLPFQPDNRVYCKYKSYKKPSFNLQGVTVVLIQGKEEKVLADDPRIKQIMMQTLHQRLSLVGSLFDFILVCVCFEK